MADELRGNEKEKLEITYDMLLDMSGKFDATRLGDFLRVMGLNPSLAALEKLGQTKKPGEKTLTLQELTPIYIESKKGVKDQGCYEDFVECLKLYDKNTNGRMVAAELSHSLKCLGEKLTDVQVDKLFDDCLPEEDDEGEIEYDIFLRKMCDKPPKVGPAVEAEEAAE